ncbi:MAG: helix-turn-helix domain-containing protein [Pirellulales bacterium]|nr:helix-turn-helix domain-containing protein [Pirellulales bacterium]
MDNLPVLDRFALFSEMVVRFDQEAARAAGKVWGGGKPGRRVRLTEEKERTIKLLSEQGKGISEISRVVGLSRPTIYKVLG